MTPATPAMAYPIEADVFDFDLPAQPYPGLRPFEKSDWPIFFGRELITGAVIDRLVAKQFMALHGDSGCGKSSLVRAGVMPRLEREHERGGATWRTTSMLPRNAPLRNLAVALAELEHFPADMARVVELRRVLNLGTKAAEHLSTIRRNERDHICILVDQFEEVFQFARNGGGDEAQLFVDVLVGLQRAMVPGLHVILTLRSEFIGASAHLDSLVDTINDTQFLLPRMDHTSLVRAIREPARLFYGQITREVADAIIADSGLGQDQLPLMQHATMLLYGRARKKANATWTIDLAAYRSAGGAARLLSTHADEVVAQIEAASEIRAGTRRAIERVFKALTDINAEGIAIRRPQSIKALSDVAGVPTETLLALLEPLCKEGASFLMILGHAPYAADELVDISHEALIRNWATLKEWTETEAEDGRRYQRLLLLAEEFEGDRQTVLGPAEYRQRRSWWDGLAPTPA